MLADYLLYCIVKPQYSIGIPGDISIYIKPDNFFKIFHFITRDQKNETGPLIYPFYFHRHFVNNLELLLRIRYSYDRNLAGAVLRFLVALIQEILLCVKR